ncbi:MAG: hypothetical protein ACLFV3_03955 [Phycisphaeraceae bacterium]
MAEISEQFVRQVVEQVLASVRQQSGGSGSQQPATPAAETATPRARLHPPAGVCTGDYSKFEELRQPKQPPAPAKPEPKTTPHPAPAGNPAPQAARSAPEHPEKLLSGFVTADQLEQAIARSGVAWLAPGARLTPLAQDVGRERPGQVRRQGRGESNDTSPPSASEAVDRWLWWAQGHCPAVQAMTRGVLRDRLRPSAAARSERGLAEVIGDLARAVDRGDVPGGVLFVDDAALAMCYANRRPELRAVQGTGESAVEAGIARLGANVLVIEYRRTSADEMQAMVERMLEQTPRVPADVQRQLAELDGR